MTLVNKFTKREPLLFLVLALLNVLPICLLTFVPTMDGAAHLYNARLIDDLLFSNPSLLNAYYTLNPQFVPNWLGHFMLVVFNKVFPVFVSEKVLLIGYALGLSYSFRSLIQAINPNNMLLSYLIFPFVYSFLLLLGFYNFSLALVFLFATLAYWIRFNGEFNTPKRVVLLALLLFVTYTAHIVVFGLLLFFLGLHSIFHLFIDKPWNFKSFVTKTASFVLAALPGLILSYFYFSSRPSSGAPVYLTLVEKFKWLVHARPLITYNMDKESLYSWVMAAVLLVFVGSGFIWMKKRSVKQKQISIFLLICLLFVFLLYALMPDSVSNAGFVSVRLCLLLFLFLICYLATLQYPLKVQLVGVLLVLAVSGIRLTYYYGQLKGLNQLAKSAYNMGKHLPENSVVLPFNFSNNWLTPHFSNYIGANKAMVVLENYEAGTGYFPVKWNNKMPQSMLVGKTQEAYDCLSWPNSSSKKTKSIDYLFVLGNVADADSCVQSSLNELDMRLVHKNDHCSLFKLAY